MLGELKGRKDNNSSGTIQSPKRHVRIHDCIGIIHQTFHAIIPNTVPPFCSTVSTSCSRHVLECHFAIYHRSRAAEIIHTSTEFVMVIQL